MQFQGTISKLGGFNLVPNASSRGIFTAADWEMVGGQFTVTDIVLLQRMRFYLLDSTGTEVRTTSTSATNLKVGLWNGDGDLMVTSSMYYLTQAMSNVWLGPGNTYTIAALVPPGYKRHTTSAVAQTAIGPQSIFIPGSAVYSIGTETLEMPDVYAAVGWPGGFAMHVAYNYPVDQDVPVEPYVWTQAQAFSIALRTTALPAGAQEWELQAARSVDGAQFGDWTTVAIIPMGQTSYLHGPLDPFDKPYYKYRYRISTDREVSPWSEERFVGKVKNAPFEDSESGGIDSAQIPQGSISPGAIRADTISAISANLGVVSAGTIRGPLIETSSTNPRIALEQDVGLYAKDGSGNDTFRLDATTGAASFSGSLTGSSFTTSASNPRVVMDSTGIFAKNAGGTDTFRLNATTGAATITGALIPTTGSIVDGQYIVAASVTAAKIGVTTLSAITADIGDITAGTLTGTTFRSSATDPKVQMDASGLHLPADPNRTDDSTYQVEWLRTPAGGSPITLARLATSDSNVTDDVSAQRSGRMYMQVLRNGVSRASTLAVGVREGSIFDQLDATYTSTGLTFTTSVDASSVYTSLISVETATASGSHQLRFLLDDNGASNWLQIPLNRTTQLLWGQVSSTATITRDGSGNWTVSKSTTGTYDITATTSVTTQAFLPVATATSANVWCQVSTVSGTGFSIQTRNSAGTLTDVGFIFQAIGRP